MNRVRIERGDTSRQEEIETYLLAHDVKEDCIVTYALADYVDEKHEEFHIKEVGNILQVRDIDVNFKPMFVSCGIDDADILFIYGYTLVPEVIMVHGVT